MKYENKVYRNLIKYFIISFFLICLIFVLIYYFILMRMDRINNKREFDQVERKFTSLIANNEKFFRQNHGDILNFIGGEDRKFIEKAYEFKNKQGIDFSFLSYDKDYRLVNSISFNTYLTKKKEQYIKILMNSYDREKYYTYFDYGQGMNLVYIKEYDRGFLCMDIACESIENLLNDYSNNFLITNSYNRLIARGGNYRNFSLNHSLMDFKDSYLKREGDFPNFKIYNIQKKFFTKDLLYLVLFLLFVVSLIYIIIISIVTKKISRKISKSFNNLLREMKMISDGKKERLRIESDDESKDIADNINNLIENVKRLEKNNVSLKYEKKAADFKTMESQFNPHFLYNTLDIISYQMYIDRDECQRLISNLSKLLRYAINDMSFVLLEEDMEYLNLYLAIQKIKYKERMDIRIEGKESLSNIMVCKLFLEPILENSFKYGFSSANKIKIRVKMYKKGARVYIDTYDSGKALGRQELVRLNENIRKKSENSFLSDNHHGLENTLKRLKILYEDAKLEFVEDENVLVRISFRI